MCAARSPRRLARSKYTATHFTVVEELDVTELVELRRQGQSDRRQARRQDHLHAVHHEGGSDLAGALPRAEQSAWDESTNEIVTFDYVNLGIATDTKNGLIVPVIDEVQSKGLMQLARELGELAERTRAGKVKPDELQGGHVHDHERRQHRRHAGDADHQLPRGGHPWCAPSDEASRNRRDARW